MTDYSAGRVELPRSAYLENSLRRARTAAEQRSHRYVTLEHLLFALLDDPDATRLLRSVGADTAVIHGAIADTVNNRMAALVVPDGRPPSFSYKFDGLFSAASEEAARLGRRELDGALIVTGLAKDPESSASAILAANGFHVAAAYRYLASPAQPQLAAQLAAPSPMSRPATAPAPPSPPAYQSPALSSARGSSALEGSPNLAAHAATMTSGEVSMDDMLASVRNILDAEERKERGLPPGAPLSPPPAAATNFARQAPRNPADGHSANYRPAVDSRDRRAAPPLGQTPPLPMYQQPQMGGLQHPTGFNELRPPHHLADANSAPRHARKARDGKGVAAPTDPALLAKIFEHIPRTTSVAVPERVQLRLSKEEANSIFGRASRRGPHLGGDQFPACRAVTVRLAAPEGGFFIEAASPETQWIFDRPSFLGEEAFGNWSWILIPSEGGNYPLTISMSVRDVDQNGLAGDLKLPNQTMEVRVRANFWRGLGRIFKTLLVLLAGSGLTAGAYYALLMMGKLPR